MKLPIQNAKYFLFPTLIVLIFSLSCAGQKSVDDLNSYDAKYTNIISNTKRIRFIGMTKVGQPQFYENVKRLIKESEQEGYVVFYEHISFENMNDTSLRKARRIFGFIPTESNYEIQMKALTTKGYAVQHNNSLMTVGSSSTVNADVSGSEIVAEYEKQFGPIELSEKDFTTPLSKKILKKLPNKNTQAIIVDYRNQQLAKQIYNSPSQKIVVLYESKHLQGLVNELAKLDPSYQKGQQTTTENNPAYLQLLTGDSIRKSTNDYIIEDGYIDQVNQFMNAKATLKDYYEFFDLYSGGKQYNIYPNSGTSLRFTADYKSISVWWTETPEMFRSNQDIEQKGKSRGFNFGFGIVNKHWFHQFNYRYIQGFYLDNTKDFNPTWKEGDKYFQEPNMGYAAIEGSTGYKFNSKFSLRSVTSQTERQLKSAGSLVTTATYRYFEIRDKEAPHFDSIISSNNLEFGLNVGYFYNWVFLKSCYLALGASPGFGIITSNVEQNKTIVNETTRYNIGVFRMSAHAGLGYNGERFILGAYTNFVAGGFFDDNIPVINTNFRNLYEVHIGYRLEVSKKVRANRLL